MLELSVIIPSCDRPDLLAGALEALSKQSAPQEDFEIIICDNSSSGSALGLSESFQSKLRNLRYFHVPAPGLHEARHKGLFESQAEILAFIDDDSKVFPSWVEAVIKTFSDKEIAMAGGNNYPDYEKTAPEWLELLWSSNEYGRYCSFYSVLDFGNTARSIDPAYIWGCNFQIRKSVLLAAGGFHPDGMPKHMMEYRGDGETAVSDYVRNAGLKAWFNPAASIKHLVSSDRMSLDYVKKRAFSQGISNAFAEIRGLMRNPDSEAPDKSPESSDLMEIIEKAEAEGHIFLEKAFLEKPDLADHIYRDNYYTSSPENKLNNSERTKFLKKHYLATLKKASEKQSELSGKLRCAYEDLSRFETQAAALTEKYIVSKWKYEVSFSPDIPILLYGAGRHTEWLLNLLRKYELRMPDLILDDSPQCQEMDKTPVAKTDKHYLKEPCLVVLSTDLHQEKLRDKLKAIAPECKTFDLYEGLPAGPFPKKQV